MRPRVLVVLAALSLSLLLPAAVGARSANSAAKAEQARIQAYWTPARMAAARSKDYVKDPKTGKITPYAKPGGGGGGGGAVTGASWAGNGEIEKRSGKLYFSTSGGNWQCTASVIKDAVAPNGYSTILTAGHCTYDQAEGWSFNVQYIPDFDSAPVACAQTVYGCWSSATRLAINSDFYPSGFGPDAALRVDYGIMRMGPGGKSGTAELDQVTGGYDLKTSGVTTSSTQWAFGYPAAGKYHGKDLTYCKGSTINDPNGVGTWGMACNMTGGSSGGPWLTDTTNPADGSGALSSLNSYGYSGLTYMFGPRFNGETSTVLGDAIDGTATANVSFVH